LGRNIQCGNSLIGPDYFEGRLVVEEAERRRVNAFDWQRAFPAIFARGGFDAVIGNPPYVRQETLGDDKKYFQKKYKVYAGTADLYSYFIEKGVSLLAHGGQFSYIVANKWMRANYGLALRKWLKTKNIEEIIDFGDLPVFESATTYPCIIRISNTKPNLKPWVTNVETLVFPSLPEYVTQKGSSLDQTQFADEGWSLTNSTVQTLLNKLKKDSVPLDKYVNGKIFRGIITGLNEAFVIDSATRDRIVFEDPKSSELVKPFLVGKDIKRYQPPLSKQYLILIPRGWTKEKSKSSGSAWKWFEKNYTAIAHHLAPFATAAEKRWDKGDYWWELRACDYYQEFEKPKIIYPNICKKPEFSFDTNNNYSNQKAFIIPKSDFFLLGILNSKLMMFFFETTMPKLRGDFYEPGFVFMKDFPIHKVNGSIPADVARHDRMVTLVQRMLDLHKQTPATPFEQERLARDISATDAEIDRLVYELYELTPEEIKIVEG